MDFDVADVVQRAATGTLPSVERVAAIVDEAYERIRGNDEGVVADYIPALAAADPDLFGIAVVGVQGASTSKGDADHLFSIQSVSKAFVYALVCNARGHETVLHQVGVNNTGLPFNSVVAIELNDGHPMNPMVNAGAIATTALAPGDSASQQWDFLLDGLSGFAGRQLVVDADVYSSERATNQRNRAIARLLDSYGRMGADTVQSVDVYTRQCSLLVSASDLALMGATLANGGVNPATGDRVVSEEVCGDTLAVLAANGLYERSGEWLFEVGLPAKSGVAGGIVCIAPGKGGMGTFSPRLDAAGNSVRGSRAAAYLSRALGLNIFASNVQTPA